MKWKEQGASRAGEQADLDGLEELDPALKQALGDFKASVHAWSDAAYRGPRQVPLGAVRRSWKLAAGWGFAVVLLAGGVSGGVFVHHKNVLRAQLAAQRAAEQQKQAAQRAEQEAQLEEDMLASVDTAVSREVPRAMEPLAQLSEEEESR
jgi:hypothetical protein